MITSSDIDKLLLSFSETCWLKVARVIGNTLDALEQRWIQMDGSVADQIDARLAVLVDTRQLEAKGDIKRWRYSEVRLPSPNKGAAE